MDFISQYHKKQLPMISLHTQVFLIMFHKKDFIQLYLNLGEMVKNRYIVL